MNSFIKTDFSMITNCNIIIIGLCEPRLNSYDNVKWFRKRFVHSQSGWMP